MYHDRYHRRSSRSGGCGLLVKVSFAANGTVNIGVVDVNLASNDNAYPFNVEGYQYV